MKFEIIITKNNKNLIKLPNKVISKYMNPERDYQTPNKINLFWWFIVNRHKLHTKILIKALAFTH